MFGIGFTELILIAIVAILFLGPDKLPETMVQIAKFIRGVKKSITDAKGALDEEMKIADLKEEALNYKAQLDNATSELKSFKNIDFDEVMESRPNPSPAPSPYASAKPAIAVEPQSDRVTFPKPEPKTPSKTPTPTEGNA